MSDAMLAAITIYGALLMVVAVSMAPFVWRASERLYQRDLKALERRFGR